MRKRLLALWGVHPICDFCEAKGFLRGIRFRGTRLIRHFPHLVCNNCRVCKLDVCIQLFADGLRELVRPEWFGEKIDTFLQWKIPANDIDAVAAGVNHF